MSADDSWKPCVFVRRFTIARMLRLYSVSLDSTFSYAAKISSTVDADVSPSGRGRQKRRDTNSAAIGGKLEERLVHQVQIEVAAADVHDERQRGLQRGDVREVLFRADAHVHAIRLRLRGRRDEVRDDVLQPAFVRQQVVGLRTCPRARKIL